MDRPDIKTLKDLPAAAKPATYLVILDYSCLLSARPRRPSASPLAGPSGSRRGNWSTSYDDSAKGRMLEEFVSLGAATGWKLKTAKPGVPSAFVFVPV